MSVGFDELFRRATGHDPFPYQRLLSERPSLPRLLRAPTGAGKTAAAVLTWLYRRRFHPDPAVRRSTPRRLLYTLPLRTLVEQTAESARRWLERLELNGDVAVHLVMGGDVDQDWVREPTADAVIVGTMDMLLSRAMNRGFASSRFRWPIEFGLLNNDTFWVLDEVQLMGNGASASAQLQGLRELLGTLRPTHSMWMSATVEPSWISGPDLPAPSEAEVLELSREDWDVPSLAPRLHARKVLKRLEVTADRGSVGILADAVADFHRPATRTLVVLNTVERATELYRELARRRLDPDILLVHSRFRPPERLDKAARLLADPPEAGLIVVATQVVEAGLDVSSATLVTDVAPWANIVQRLGRCNRYGELGEAAVFWLDGPDSAPYEREDWEQGRKLLLALEGQSVGPRELEGLPRGDPPRTTYVLRRSDLLDLFDTEPDLSGNDVDVSRFIRDDADVDVHLFWRHIDDSTPSPDTRRPHRDELCDVPVWRARELIRRIRRTGPPAAFIWDHLDGQWRAADEGDLRPGVIVLVDSRAGGYSPEYGFDPRSPAVEPVPLPEPPERLEGFDSEGRAEADGGWVTIEQHGLETAEIARRFAAELLEDATGTDWVREAVTFAARWHDVGKAHPVFQDALLANLPPDEAARRKGELWAKSSHGLARPARPRFRHELVSALVLLGLARDDSPGLVSVSAGGDERYLDLAAYLVASHHGKIRLAIRSLPGDRMASAPSGAAPSFAARGVQDGDELPPFSFAGIDLPALRLDLSVMAIGASDDGWPSWLERTLRLRDELGPFRLAFLEALVRVADWQASAGHGGLE